MTRYFLLILQNARVELEETLPGTGGGQNPNEDLLVKFLILLPLVFFGFCYYRSSSQVSNFDFLHFVQIFFIRIIMAGILSF